MIEVYFDGACEPINPRGIATYGFVIYRNGEKIKEEGGLACEPLSDRASNNVAEYTALVKALEYLVEAGMMGEEVVVRGDSQLAIRQLNGVYAVRSWRIIPLYEKAVKLIGEFKSITFEWVPRERNEEADELSHRAYEEFLDKHPEVLRKIERHMATEKQIKFLKKLGIKPYKYISKRDASRLIKRALSRKKI